MNITLYSKPHCVQCTATKRALEKAGLTFETIDVSIDAAALTKIRDMGFMQAPVVETDVPVIDSQGRGENTVLIAAWSGFRPDLLAQLTQ